MLRKYKKFLDGAWLNPNLYGNGQPAAKSE